MIAFIVWFAVFALIASIFGNGVLLAISILFIFIALVGIAFVLDLGWSGVIGSGLITISIATVLLVVARGGDK